MNKKIERLDKMNYYLYLCRPIYIVLLWESLINIR